MNIIISLFLTTNAERIKGFGKMCRNTRWAEHRISRTDYYKIIRKGGNKIDVQDCYM